MKKTFLIAVGILLLLAALVRAETPIEDLAKKFASSYPAETHITGVGMVPSSGDNHKDRRRAEILARVELARVVRSALKVSSIVIMCEGSAKALYDSQRDCQNHFEEIIEESVDEVLEGSKIVDAGEIKVQGTNQYYAVAVLPKKDAMAKAEAKSQESEERAKEHIAKAKSATDEDTRKEETKNAKEEIKKVEAYNSEKDALGQVKQDSKYLYDKLDEVEHPR